MCAPPPHSGLLTLLGLESVSVHTFNKRCCDNESRCTQAYGRHRSANLLVYLYILERVHDSGHMSINTDRLKLMVLFSISARR